MRLALLITLLMLLNGCGKQAHSLPVLTGKGMAAQITEISSENYGSRLEQLTETYLAQTSSETHPDYQLEVLTLGLFLDAGTEFGPIEASTQSHLELHFRVAP